MHNYKSFMFYASSNLILHNNNWEPIFTTQIHVPSTKLEAEQVEAANKWGPWQMTKGQRNVHDEWQKSEHEMMQKIKERSTTSLSQQGQAAKHSMDNTSI
jgi:hypothetical protein